LTYLLVALTVNGSCDTRLSDAACRVPYCRPRKSEWCCWNLLSSFKSW